MADLHRAPTGTHIDPQLLVHVLPDIKHLYIRRSGTGECTVSGN